MHLEAIANGLGAQSMYLVVLAGRREIPATVSITADTGWEKDRLWHNGEWSTPQEFFDKLDAQFHFTLDVCAVPENAKCERYFTPEINGLSQKWTGVCWMNPPYGRGIGKWIRKAYESSLGGVTVVCLIPARTDTSWWHDYVMRGEIQFLRGRLCFSPNGDRSRRAPFPCAIVIFNPAIFVKGNSR